MNEGVYVMNYSVAISMADTINIDNLKDNETARTFVDNWVSRYTGCSAIFSASEMQQKTSDSSKKAVLKHFSSHTH